MCHEPGIPGSQGKRPNHGAALLQLDHKQSWWGCNYFPTGLPPSGAFSTHLYNSISDRLSFVRMSGFFHCSLLITTLSQSLEKTITTTTIYCSSYINNTCNYYIQFIVINSISLFLNRRISEDDARRTFQLARSNAKHFAIVFVAWAQFELSLGLCLNKLPCMFNNKRTIFSNNLLKCKSFYLS